LCQGAAFKSEVFKHFKPVLPKTVLKDIVETVSALQACTE
jgi:hypothetical protein